MIRNGLRRLLDRLPSPWIDRLVSARDGLEWRLAQATRRRAPWSRNRFGQRFQALSLADYRYLRKGNPEDRESRLAERLIGPGMTVIDVGANHGLFSLEAARFVGPTGRVHAFEPTPRTLERFEEHLRVNGLTWVRASNSAVGDSPGVARLRVHNQASGLNTMAADDIQWKGGTLVADEVLEVPIVTLDDYARSEGLGRVDFLKIDVEGYELGVIRGARELLGARRIGAIMLEIGDVTCANAGVAAADIVDELEARGYGLFEILPDGGTGPRVRKPAPSPDGINYLALALADVPAQVREAAATSPDPS